MTAVYLGKDVIINYSSVCPGCHFSILQLFFTVFLRARLQAGGWKMVTYINFIRPSLPTLDLSSSCLRQSIFQHSSRTACARWPFLDYWFFFFPLLFFPFVSPRCTRSVWSLSVTRGQHFMLQSSHLGKCYIQQWPCEGRWETLS